MRKLLTQLTVIMVLINLFIVAPVKGQSCSSNNIGFNGNTATNTITICEAVTGITINGGNPSGSETFLWQVSTVAASGPFSTVSPNPGDAQNWTISSVYYNNPGTYYFRRVISGNASCNGNSDVVTFTVNALPNDVTVTGGGTYCSTNPIINASNGGSGTIYFQGTTSGGTSTSNPSTSELITVSGTYYFRARAASGCWGNEGSATVLIQTAPVTTGTIICQGGASTITSSTVCPGFVNSGTTITGSWNAATDQVANRLNGGISNTASCAFESPAVNRNYTKQDFQVSVTGSYTFAMVQNNSYDAMGYIVTGAFVPGNCAGGGSFIRGDDDNGPSDEPSMTATLTAGVTYSLISTTYSTTSGTFSGSYNWGITTASGGQVMLPVDSDIQWFTAPSGGAAIGTGASFNPVGIPGSGLVNTNTPGTTVYYAECSAAGGCRTATDFIINPLPVAPAGNASQELCTGSTVGDLQASGTSLKWYLNSTGGIPLNPADPLMNATHYFASQTAVTGCEGTDRLDVFVTVLENATISLGSANGTDDQSVCNNSDIATISYNLGGGASGASVTGLPPGVTGTYEAGNFTISGTPSAAGTYNYTVTTTGSCVQAVANGTIKVNALPVIDIDKTNVSQCINNNGTIAVNAGGGTAPYTYTWSGVTGSGNPATTPYPSPGNVSSVNGLTIGYYNVEVTDANGCQSSVSDIHVEYAYLVYITSTGSISSTCSNTGSIILYGNAGVQPYTYSLDGVTYQGSNTFTGLAEGTYTAYVKDASGCASTKSVTVAAAAPITVSPNAVGSSSCSNDGSIQVFRSGGIAPYTYSLTSATGPWQTSNFFPALAAGSYTAYVKDATGCVGQASATVTQGAALNVTASSINTSTCVFDGAIQATVSGGVAPYMYSKDGGASFQPGNSFTGLSTGNYTIIAKDSKGCTGFVNVTINQNPISVTTYVVNASSCASSNGSIQIFRTGGVGPYTYSIDGNNYFTSPVFTGLAAGEYDCFVKDSKTCLGFQFGVVVGPTCPAPRVATATKAQSSSNVKLMVNEVLSASAYPNPSNTEFTLSLTGGSKEKLSIVVTDIMGRKVYQTEGYAGKQNRFGSSFITGIYNVQVVQGTAKQSIKLVKE